MSLSLFRGLSFRLLAAAVLLGSGVVFGIAQDANQPAPAPAPAEAPPPPPETVLATVDGNPITQADVDLAIADLDQQFSRLPPEQRRAAALSAIIEIRLLAAKARSEKLDQTPDFQRRIGFLTDRTLHSALVAKDVAGAITDQEIRARYDQEVANTPPVNEIHARHILVKTKEEALDIIKQLEAGGDFEKLANEKTNDPSGKSSGGDLGWFGPGQMVPEFEKAAFALNVGEYTKEPVQTQFGWHVIQVVDKRAKQPPAFDQVKDQVKSILLREKYFALVKQVRGDAKIEISDPALKASVDALEKSQQQ
jgi:peptidyl-prolyl cis-trans isomerase C